MAQVARQRVRGRAGLRVVVAAEPAAEIRVGAQGGGSVAGASQQGHVAAKALLVLRRQEARPMGQLERPLNRAALFLDVGYLPVIAHHGGAQPPAGLLDPLLQLHPILVGEHARQEFAGVQLERVTRPT